MSQPPQVSVVMAVYNAEPYVREAVLSLLGQSLEDFELVIVDDGSVDGTPAILSSLQLQDARIRVIKQPNRGIAVALNSGIGRAAGKYIARLDADDVAYPHRLQQQVEFLDANSGVGLLGGAIDVMDSSGKPAYRVSYPQRDAEIRRSLPYRTCFAHSAVTMRKDAFISAGGYRKQFTFAEDYDLWLRMVEQAQAANLADVVTRHRIHAESVSQQNLERQAMRSLGAKAAARMRNIANSDPFDEVEQIDQRTLVRNGVPQGQVRMAIALANLRWANTQFRLGGVDDGIACFATGLRWLLRKVPSSAHEAAPTAGGRYYDWRELVARILIVIWRAALRPFPTIKALLRKMRPAPSLPQSPP